MSITIKTVRNFFLVLSILAFLGVGTAFAEDMCPCECGKTVTECGCPMAKSGKEVNYTNISNYESHFNPFTMQYWDSEIIKHTDTQAIYKISKKDNEHNISDIKVLLIKEANEIGLQGYSYTYKGERHVFIFDTQTKIYERVEGSLEDWYDKGV